MDEEPSPQPVVKKITLPLKEFLDYIWNVNQVATSTCSTRAVVRRALGELILMLDPPHPVSLSGEFCHVELLGDDTAEIWQIPQWRNAYERRQAQDKLRELETAAKERTKEYSEKLAQLILHHESTKGMFNKAQADIVALQILRKKQLAKAAYFGLVIPSDEMLMV